MIAVAQPHYYDDIEPEAEAFAAGDSEAYTLIFNRYRERLRFIAQRYLARDLEYNEVPSPEDIEDLIQATFLSVWEHRYISGYTVDRPVIIWLRGCLWRTYWKRRRAVNAKMRKPRSGEVDSLDRLKEELAIVAVDRTSPDSDLIRAEAIEVVESAFSVLTQERQETLGAWSRGATLEQIGNRKGVSHQAVQRMVSRSLKAMARVVIPALVGQPV